MNAHTAFSRFRESLSSFVTVSSALPRPRIAHVSAATANLHYH
jgi:hypothetical protein